MNGEQLARLQNLIQQHQKFQLQQSATVAAVAVAPAEIAAATVVAPAAALPAATDDASVTAAAGVAVTAAPAATTVAAPALVAAAHPAVPGAATTVAAAANQPQQPLEKPQMLHEQSMQLQHLLQQPQQLQEPQQILVQSPQLPLPFPSNSIVPYGDGEKVEAFGDVHGVIFNPSELTLEIILPGLLQDIHNASSSDKGKHISENKGKQAVDFNSFQPLHGLNSDLKLDLSAYKGLMDLGFEQRPEDECFEMDIPQASRVTAKKINDMPEHFTMISPEWEAQMSSIAEARVQNKTKKAGGTTTKTSGVRKLRTISTKL